MVINALFKQCTTFEELFRFAGVTVLSRTNTTCRSFTVVKRVGILWRKLKQDVSIGESKLYLFGI